MGISVILSSLPFFGLFFRKGCEEVGLAKQSSCIDFMEKRGLTVGRRGWKVILLAINNEPTELLGRHLFFIRVGS